MRGRRCAKRSRGGRSRPLVRRLRVRPRQPGTRAASGPALGALRPLCEVHRRDTQARTGAEAKAERLLPRAAAERREARRRAIPPVISGHPEIGLAARRVTGCGVPHQRLSALCSPHFLGVETDKGYPPPSQRAGGALAKPASFRGAEPRARLRASATRYGEEPGTHNQGAKE
jgi:hypothetical protein